MIEVSLHTLIVIYLSLMAGLVLADAIGNWIRRKRRERRAFKHAVRCRLCAFTFRDESAEPLPSCPNCGTSNERIRLSRL